MDCFWVKSSSNDCQRYYEPIFEGLKKFVLKNKEAITQMYNPKDLFDVNTYNILDKDPSQFKRLLENTIERIVNSFNFRIFLDKDQSVLLNRYISGNHKNTRDLIIKDDNCEQKSGYNQDL